MDYNKIIELLLHDYNMAFSTNFKILYDTRENLLKLEPTLVLRENTAGVYHNKSKRIFINKDVIDKINRKNFNNKGNQYHNGLAFLIHSCFHELEHRKQSEYTESLVNQKDIYPIMYKIEQLLITIFQYENKYEEYAKMHDKFISEIDADIKGNKNLKSFAEKYKLPINPDYIKLFNYYNIFRENNYEPIYFINIFNEKIKEYPKFFQDSMNDAPPSQRKINDFYDSNGNLKTLEEIMNLKGNPLLPYIVSSITFINSLKNRILTKEQMTFIYNNIRFVIDEHIGKREKMETVKEILQPRFEEFIQYTQISKSKSSKSIQPQNFDNYYEDLETVSSTIKQYMSIDKKRK